MKSPCPAFAPESNVWLASLRGDCKSSGTLDCYERDLRVVGDALEHLNGRRPVARDLAAVDQSAVDKFAELWFAEPVGVPTVLRRFAALRGFARYLSTKAGLDCSRLLSADLPTMVHGPRKTLEDQDVAAISQASVGKDISWLVLRNSAMFAVQASAAVTTAELVALNIGDLCAGSITVTNSRLLPRPAAISAAAESAVSSYLDANPFTVRRESPLFLNCRGGRVTARSVQVCFRQRRRELGIQMHAGPMALRHSVGYRLAEDGHSLETVAQILGVRPSTAARYFEPQRDAC
jgi:integrase/recombinase XerC